jgi:hypothetical protein
VIVIVETYFNDWLEWVDQIGWDEKKHISVGILIHDLPNIPRECKLIFNINSICYFLYLLKYYLFLYLFLLLRITNNQLNS